MSKDVSADLLRRVADTLDAYSSWILFSHQKLDGDAAGTASALFEAGVSRGKRVLWMGPDPVPPAYSFLPHADQYVCCRETLFDSRDDLYIFLDSANEERGVKGLKEKNPESVILNIDHHADNSLFGTINCVDPSASSAAELLWRVMKSGGWEVTPVVAECLYTGIFADTGGFLYSNTTAGTHRVVADLLDTGFDAGRVVTLIQQTRSLESMHLWGTALARIVRWGQSSQIALTWLGRDDFEAAGAMPSDTENLASQLMLIRGVRFGVLLSESMDGSGIRVSFRSKDDAVTASDVAHSLGGGGHPRASGATLEMSLDDAVRTVREAVEKAYAGWLAAD